MDLAESKFLRIKRELGFWNKTTKVLLFGVITVCVVGVVLADYGFLRMIQLRRERGRLEAEITSAKMKHRLLEDLKWKLENDTFYLEKLGRERCGLYKDGEIIFLFEDGDSSAMADGGRISLDNFSLNR